MVCRFKYKQIEFVGTKINDSLILNVKIVDHKGNFVECKKVTTAYLYLLYVLSFFL